MPKKTPSARPAVASASARSEKRRAGAKAPLAVSAHAPRNHRELAQAIFAECDPVTVGRELLESGSEHGGTVKARVWETLVEFLFGKPAPAAGTAGTSAGVHIVWDMPAPPHESGS